MSWGSYDLTCRRGLPDLALRRRNPRGRYCVRHDGRQAKGALYLSLGDEKLELGEVADSLRGAEPVGRLKIEAEG